MLKQLIRPLIRPNLHKPDLEARYSFYGTEYGGWPLIDDHVGANAVLYSFGIGEDISFDLAVIARFGLEVHAFDPTPKSVGWISAQSLPKTFHFHPVGISDLDGTADFFPPANAEHVSYSSAPNTAHGGAPVQAAVRTLASLMSDLGHAHIDILKMDVEGFEYKVLANLLSSGIFPGFILVEFHHRLYGVTNADTRAAVSRIRDAGYRLFYVSRTGREYGFWRPAPHSTSQGPT